MKFWQKERLRDWFNEKYDFECYKIAEKELKDKKKIARERKFWKVNETERLWLIERTKILLDEKWESKLNMKEEQ